MFHNLGFPDWFRILIGVLETAAAALLLVPRTAAYGAAVVIPVMIGAIVTMATHGWVCSLSQPSITLVFMIIILIARWRQRLVITRGRPLAPRQ